MPPKKGEEEDPPETLASASGKNVEGLLNRVGRRRGAPSGAPAPALAGVLPPPPRRGAAAPGACGAPAVADQDAEQDNIDQNDAEEDPESHGHAAPLLPAASADPDSDEGEWDEGWEDVEDDDVDIGAILGADQPGTSAGGGGGGITVSLDGPAAVGPSTARRGRTFTKEDREIAREVHRAHLLCLLGRGLLFDAAAADPLLQSVMLSLVPPAVVSQASKVHSVSEEMQEDGLEALVAWFRGSFKLLRASAVAAPAEGEDEISAAIARAKGLPAVVEHLVGVAMRQEGTAEELATVFAAALRALGLAARCVRLLEPSSLKPGDALRQRENAVKEYMKRPSRRQAAGPVSLVAQAASELLEGTASQRLDNLREHVAANLGVEADAVKIKPGRGPNAPLSITLDRRKLKKQGRGGGGGGGGRGGRGGSAKKAVGRAAGPKVAVGPEGGKEEQKEGGKGRKRKQAAAAETAVGAGGSKEGDDGVIDLTEDVEGVEDVEGTGSGKKKRKSAAEKEEEAVAAVAADGSVPLQAVQERQQGTKTRKRKCDEELERELEVAMAATAFETRRQVSSPAAAAAASPSAPKRATNRATGGGARGAAFGAHQGHVGRYWVEMYCGATASGRWVHVCPISGWIDRAADVEGLAPRGQPLAYVVALSGGGGAKDVTRRYASSFLGAQKHRDEGWWGETMAPLARREAAAAAALHGAPAAPAAAAPAKVAAGKPPAALLAAAREDRELEQRAAAERAAVPTTIADFKNHKDLILERHIGKHQALQPGSKPVGSHKGEAYYLRSNVGDVHTAERWRRLGREVLPAEMDRPAKRLKKRQQGGGGRGGRGGRNASGPPRRTLNPWEGLEEDANGEEGSGGGGAGGGGESEEAGTSTFYGIWQTREWAPPAAQGGKVPKNERGNVEVPPLAAALPAGTVHLRLSAGAVCRKLGIDYAPALTGFDIRAGRSVPNLDGVVVCAEHAEVVRAAFDEEEALKAARAREKRMEESEKLWRGLMGALLTKMQLKRAYGVGGAEGEGPTTAEGEAAAMLVHNAANGKLQARGRKRDGEEGQAATEQGGGGDAYAAAAADVEVEEI